MKSVRFADDPRETPSRSSDDSQVHSSDKPATHEVPLTPLKTEESSASSSRKEDTKGNEKLSGEKGPWLRKAPEVPSILSEPLHIHDRLPLWVKLLGRFFTIVLAFLVVYDLYRSPEQLKDPASILILSLQVIIIGFASWFMILMGGSGLPFKKSLLGDIAAFQKNSKDAVIIINSFEETSFRLMSTVITASINICPLQEDGGRFVVALIDDPSKPEDSESIQLCRKIDQLFTGLRYMLQSDFIMSGKLAGIVAFLHHAEEMLQEEDPTPHDNEKHVYRCIRRVREQMTRYLHQLGTRQQLQPQDIEIIRSFANVRVLHFRREGKEGVSQLNTRAANLNAFLTSLRDRKLRLKGCALDLDDVRMPLFAPDPNSGIGVLESGTTVEPSWFFNLSRLLLTYPKAAIAQSSDVVENDGSVLHMLTRSEARLQRYLLSGIGYDSLLKASNLMISGSYLFSLGLDDKLVQDDTACVNFETSLAAWKKGYNVVQWHEPICAVTPGAQDVARFVQDRERVLNGPLVLAFKALFAKVHRRFARCRMLLLLPTFMAILSIQILMFQLTEPPNFFWMTMAAQMCMLISLTIKDMKNILEPFALLGSVQVVTPVLALATFKSFYQTVTGMKVDSIRKPVTTNMDLPVHYKLFYVVILGVNAKSLLTCISSFHLATTVIRALLTFSFLLVLFSDYLAECTSGVAKCCVDDIEATNMSKEAFLDQDTEAESKNEKDTEIGELDGEEEKEVKSTAIEHISIVDVEGMSAVEGKKGTYMQTDVPEVV
mmetsp:Transcript_29123/g.71043  ORF Transcript_29123/g.71043 Transcript_29123/m.71043 type:complete len:772 (-) Transcript_29123:258-2573(-)